LYLKNIKKKRNFYYNHFVLPLEFHEWSSGTHLPLPCVVGHAATFAVNAALVVTKDMKVCLAPIHYRTRGWTGHKYSYSCLRFDDRESNPLYQHLWSVLRKSSSAAAE